MNIPDIIYILISHSNIQTSYNLSRTCHLYYTVFNESRIWIHYLQQLINYNELHRIWINSEKETYRKCIKISKLITLYKFNDTIINFFIKKELLLSNNTVDIDTI